MYSTMTGSCHVLNFLWGCQYRAQVVGTNVLSLISFNTWYTFWIYSATGYRQRILLGKTVMFVTNMTVLSTTGHARSTPKIYNPGSCPNMLSYYPHHWQRTLHVAYPLGDWPVLYTSLDTRGYWWHFHHITLPSTACMHEIHVTLLDKVSVAPRHP